MKHDLVLGVPFCRHTPLDPFLTALDSSDLAGLDRKICCLFVVDQAPKADFVKELESRAAQLKLAATIIVNDRPLGFVGSSNRIFEFAVARQNDVVLLDPDTLLFPGTMAEMSSVAESDPMIGFVGPHSNAGAIGKFPLLPTGLDAESPESAFAAFEALSSRLPPKTYVPTVDGLCLLVKLKMLQSFGCFELVTGPFMEENDLIACANRYGYRAAIANHAFVFHVGGRQPRARQNGEIEVMREQYPHYHAAVSRYFKSPTYRALRLISSLAATPPLPIAFDFSSFGRRKDGTTEYGTRLVASFARRFKSTYEINVICEPSVWKHHQLDSMDGLIRSPVAADTLFPAIIRLGQPFDLDAVSRIASCGAVSIVTMLDCIAYDCLHICPPELEALWKFTLGYFDAVIFPSEFSRARFADRFPGARRGRDVVSMPSTDVDEYKPSTTISSAGDYLLVVGNSFAHKAVSESVDVIRHGLPAEKLKVLGDKLPRQAGLTSYQSGVLRPSFVQELFANAKAVIFPSHYEGFGFPLMHALGNRKPIFVRDLPVYEEIRQRVSYPDNIHAFSTNEELVNMLARQDFRWDETSRQVGEVGWDRAAGELEAALAQALSEATLERIESRIEQLDLLEEAFSGSQARVSQLEDQIKGIQTSTSWRVTAPLRKLKMLFS